MLLTQNFHAKKWPKDVYAKKNDSTFIWIETFERKFFCTKVFYQKFRTKNKKFGAKIFVPPIIGSEIFLYQNLFWARENTILIGLDTRNINIDISCDSFLRVCKGQTDIQGVPQYCFHFYFINFSASKASRSSILDIFQQPFQCRF